jgi:outer membrane protein OmpA-like peptidoglycan-associated protein
LKQLANRVRQLHSFRHLQVIGHTDSIGAHEYNMMLSQKRAETIRQYLITAGLPGEKIEAIGRGEMEPVADNGNFQGRQQNRRVEFILEK